MNKTIGIILGLLVLAGAGVFAFSGNKVEEIEVIAPSEEARVVEETPLVEELTSTASAGFYGDYAAEKLAMASTGDVVLFFHASWCPSCRGLNNDIEENISEIPAGVTILKADYDKETELKKQYGVTTQHTLVQVDQDGTLIKKWSGGSKLEDLLAQIQ